MCKFDTCLSSSPKIDSMRVEPQFISVGVNRIVNALDWGDNGFIAYAGHHIVCIYEPETAEVLGTLTGHKGQVNCVKWLPASVCPPGVLLLLSGAADSSIRLWAWHGKGHSPPWQCMAELKAHQSAVTSLALHQIDADTLLLASTSADPQLQLWHCSHNSSSSKAGQQDQQQLLQARFGPGAWHLQPPVHVGSQIQHCVALAELPEDPGWLVMATGGTECTIRLFVWGPAAANAAPAAAGEEFDANGDGLQQQQQQQRFVLQCQLKGHENWVRAVQFVRVAEAAPGMPGGQRVSLLLASAAQDRYGRVWCLTTDASRSSTSDIPAPPPAAGSSSQPDALRQLITRYAPRPHLSTPKSTYWVSLEALLVGHEDWLHSISWRPIPAVAGASATSASAAGSSSSSSSSSSVAASREDLTLLSVSQDRSMMLWSYDKPSGLWVSEAAVGDAGASCLGFYGGAFGPNGDWLVAHGFTGALHLWKQQQQQQSGVALNGSALAAAAAGLGLGGSSSSISNRCSWVPQHALGGHYGAVVDLAWGGDGGCLQSVSTDQTARLFTGIAGHWFEMARTQVHGHDFSCLATIPTPPAAAAAAADTCSNSSAVLSPSLLCVSGSEEKVLRVFEAPQAFVNTLTAIRGSQSPEAAAAVAAALAAARSAAAASSGNDKAGAAASGSSRTAFGASVSALGLSNKALYAEDQADSGSGGNSAGVSGSGFGAEAYNEGPDFVPCASPSVVTSPPLEEHLAQNTLWPEVRKLYGHGNDVFCLCSAPNGRIIASACKAQSAGAAAVWLWEVGSWKSLAQLPGHTLTVTQLEFSPDGRLLLSGSRDRSFSVWRVPEPLAGPAAAGGTAGTQNGAAAAAAAEAKGSSGGEEGFELLLRLKSAHSRIVWGVSWSYDSRLFATGSRDQTVKLWAVDSQGRPQQKPVCCLPAFPVGITAVALAPQHVCAAAAAAGISAAAASLHLLAVGLEDGQVQVWSVEVPGQQQQEQQQQQQQGEVKVQQLWAGQAWEQHAAAVRRLRWAPAGVDWLCGSSAAGGLSGCCVQLASCGDDHSVRVYGVTV